MYKYRVFELETDNKLLEWTLARRDSALEELAESKEVQYGLLKSLRDNVTKAMRDHDDGALAVAAIDIAVSKSYLDGADAILTRAKSSY